MFICTIQGRLLFERRFSEWFDFLFVYKNLTVFLRGSNNRLNEKTNGRANGNRLFDSQNNMHGGYNVADSTDLPATNETEQHSPIYFQSDKEVWCYN